MSERASEQALSRSNPFRPPSRETTQDELAYWANNPFTIGTGAHPARLLLPKLCCCKLCLPPTSRLPISTRVCCRVDKRHKEGIQLERLAGLVPRGVLAGRAEGG